MTRLKSVCVWCIGMKRHSFHTRLDSTSCWDIIALLFLVFYNPLIIKTKNLFSPSRVPIQVFLILIGQWPGLDRPRCRFLERKSIYNSTCILPLLIDVTKIVFWLDLLTLLYTFSICHLKWCNKRRDLFFFCPCCVSVLYLWHCVV